MLCILDHLRLEFGRAVAAVAVADVAVASVDPVAAASAAAVVITLVVFFSRPCPFFFSYELRLPFVAYCKWTRVIYVKQHTYAHTNIYFFNYIPCSLIFRTSQKTQFRPAGTKVEGAFEADDLRVSKSVRTFTVHWLEYSLDQLSWQK